MKLAILETGYPPGNLADEFGDYSEMFQRLLGPGFEVKSFDVQSGVLPAADGHNAYLITGSPAGVYDPLPWIAPLEQFIRDAGDAKMVGICFGHQAMAEALGGHVEKSEKGWGAGLHRYTVVRPEPWIDTAGTIAIPALTIRQSIGPFAARASSKARAMLAGSVTSHWIAAPATRPATS
jgi:GMP synthase-like glutamine amidotransferase